MGGEELLEIAFFRFSFFRRRVPPIESSLKGDIIIVIEKQIQNYNTSNKHSTPTQRPSFDFDWPSPVT